MHSHKDVQKGSFVHTNPKPVHKIEMLGQYFESVRSSDE